MAPQAASVPASYPQLEIGKQCFSLAAEIVAHGIRECQRLGIPPEYAEDVRSLAISFLISRDRNGGAR
jgi:hypothetical protein